MANEVAAAAVTERFVLDNSAVVAAKRHVDSK